jgi:hypothetical protein
MTYKAIIVLRLFNKVFNLWYQSTNNLIFIIVNNPINLKLYLIQSQRKRNFVKY